ncbi:MAG: hypothetical protein COX17_05710 [Deltaproteobacteria bacterium CG23_combo_of_CG06-09_8_20_14_all_60_8]|nr:MAG: hypothetical protein AUK28_06995 [Desulfobacterales bacterium CG2_30_60_27]PIP43673.1 MAG: hypothetical protein COX17_05710 [Deltaproteobacteria bacterium CG23_combo_of_CG06-09_8_20_14_all_60_8]
MIDPELRYCPQCGDEYRADISHCAVCRVALISGRQRLQQEEEHRAILENRSVDIREGEELVVVYRGPLADIKTLQEVLAARRIGFQVSGDENSCAKKGCSPAMLYLQVRRQEAAEAMQLLDAAYRKATGLDGSALEHTDAVFDQSRQEATCPACGHCFSTNLTTCPDCGLCFG